MTVLLPLIVCVLGGLFYLFSRNGKIARMGLISFSIGLAVFLLVDVPRVVAFFGIK